MIGPSAEISKWKLAKVAGIEPALAVLETAALPLSYTDTGPLLMPHQTYGLALPSLCHQESEVIICPSAEISKEVFGTGAGIEPAH